MLFLLFWIYGILLLHVMLSFQSIPSFLWQVEEWGTASLMWNFQNKAGFAIAELWPGLWPIGDLKVCSEYSCTCSGKGNPPLAVRYESAVSSACLKSLMDCWKLEKNKGNWCLLHFHILPLALILTAAEDKIVGLRGLWPVTKWTFLWSDSFLIFLNILALWSWSC